MAAQLIRMAVQVGTIAVLARLLTPTEFGLVAMITAVVGLGEVLRDFGLTQAATRERFLSRAQQSNLFWLNAFIGAGFGVFAFSLSWPIAYLYGDDSLVPLMQLLSLTFFLNGLSAQYRAQLMRDLRFGSLAAVEIVGQLTGAAAAVGLALTGAGVYSLVFQQLVAGVCALLLLVVLTRWIPGGWCAGIGTRRFLAFGGYLSLTQVLAYLSRNVDSMALGVLAGARQVGIYSRAFQLLIVPLNQINAPATRVALPVLARLIKDPPRFDRYILAGQRLLLHPICAAFLVAAATSSPLVSVILGPGWGEVVPVFAILSLSAIFQAAGYATYWAFLAHGAAKQSARYSLFSRPAMAVLICCAAPFGIEATAIAFTASTAILWPWGLWWVGRSTATPAFAMFTQGVRVIGLHVPPTIVAGTVVFFTNTSGPILSLALGVTGFLVAHLVLLFVPTWRRELYLLVSDLGVLRSRGGQSVYDG